MAALDSVLLELARDARVTEDAPTAFACPDCEGDPGCSTCGEPTRGIVLSWLQRTFRRRAA